MDQRELHDLRRQEAAKLGQGCLLPPLPAFAEFRFRNETNSSQKIGQGVLGTGALGRRVPNPWRWGGDHGDGLQVMWRPWWMRQTEAGQGQEGSSPTQEAEGNNSMIIFLCFCFQNFSFLFTDIVNSELIF